MAGQGTPAHLETLAGKPVTDKVSRGHPSGVYSSHSPSFLGTGLANINVERQSSSQPGQSGRKRRANVRTASEDTRPFGRTGPLNAPTAHGRAPEGPVSRLLKLTAAAPPQELLLGENDQC